MNLKIKILFPLLLCCIMIGPGFSGQLSPSDYQKLDPRLALILDHPELKSLVYHQMTGKNYAEMITNIKVMIKTTLSNSTLHKLGVTVQARIENIITAKLPIDMIPDLVVNPEILYIQGSRVATIHNDVSMTEIGALQARQQYSLSGKGVIIGIVDTGIDWRHDDFRNADGTTRIKLLLDLTEAGSDQYSGTLYTEQEINNALKGIGTVNERDYVGHGTHVAGSAAGNGRSTGNGIPSGTYIGVAPEADLIIVKGTTDSKSFNFESNDYMNASNFIDSVATAWNMPYVINLSLGGSLGPHDGTDLSEQWLDQILAKSTPKGKAIVVSAGNDGDNPIHASGTFSIIAANIETQFTIPSYTPNANNVNDYVVFEGWYDAKYSYSIKVTSPSGETLGPINSGRESGKDTKDGAIVISNAPSGASPLNGDKQILIQVYDNTAAQYPKQGVWKININGSTGRFDLWLSGSSMNASITSNIDNSMIVGTPGTAFNTITVGSYITKKKWTDLDGNTLQSSTLIVSDASTFSSPGPTRDGRIKPEISAPGEMITASYSTDAPPSSASSIFKSSYSQWPNAYIARDNKHALSQGTSFAAPHVSGTIALILQQNPNKKPDEIRQAIIASARTDSYTGQVPNNIWGYGKLNVMAALLLLAVNEPGSTPTVPTSMELGQNYPNPFNPTTVIPYSTHTTTKVRIHVFNLMGQQIRTLIDEEQKPGNYKIMWDGNNALGKTVTSGIYFYRLDAEGFSQTRKMILLP